MSKSLSRNQILKATGAFIAGAAVAKSLPGINDSPAQAQSCLTSLCVSSGGGFNSPQVFVGQTSANDYARIRLASGGRPSWDIAVGGSGNVMNFFYSSVPGQGGQNVMNLFTDKSVRFNGNVQYCGSLTQCSSREIKENITELSSKEAFEALEVLSPVKYKYKDIPGEEQVVGFIAEDVPELVASSDKKAIRPIDIVGVLTKVVQEQQKTILSLAEKVKALEGKNFAS